MCNEKQQEREYWYDNAKSLLIILVVVGHVIGALLGYADFVDGMPTWLRGLFKFIYTFHMPVFMAISGKFSRSRIQKKDYIAVVNKLLIPYLLAQLLLLAVYLVLDYEPVGKLLFLSPFFGMWYLLALAVYQLITPLLIRCRWLLLPALAVALAVNFLPAPLRLGGQRMVTFYPFFLFGYYLAERPLNFAKRPLFRLLSGVALAGLLALCIVFAADIDTDLLSLNHTYAVSAKVFSRRAYFAWLLLRYAVGFACVFWVLGLCSVKKTPLTYVGVHSNYVYILHLPLTVWLRDAARDHGLLDGLDTVTEQVLLVLGSVLLALLLASPPMRRVTRLLVAPHVDIRHWRKGNKTKEGTV